jgi:hypothetical protein
VSVQLLCLTGPLDCVSVQLLCLTGPLDSVSVQLLSLTAPFSFPWRMDEIIRNIGVILNYGEEPKLRKKTLFQCHFVFHSTHMDCPGNAVGPPR